MPIAVIPADPCHPDFVGIVSGVDLTHPPTASVRDEIESAIDHYAVLVFRGQPIDNDQQLRFTRLFGTLEALHRVPGDSVQAGRLPIEISDISNLDRNNKILARDDRQRLFQLGNLLWHSDSSYKTVPARYSFLSARAIPDRGGATQFADMRAAWDTLDADTQSVVRDMVSEHSRLFSRTQLGFDFTAEEARDFTPVPHPLVRRHPITGRLALFLSAHGGTIVGWPVPEARAMLRELAEHATARERVYSHRWQIHDLMMWDNRTTMHRGLRAPVDQMRDLRRTSTADVPTQPVRAEHAPATA